MVKIKSDGEPTEEDDDAVSIEGMFPTNPRARLMAELDAKRETLKDAEVAALARKAQLRLSDFLILTGIEPVDWEWDMYRISPERVEFVGLEWDRIKLVVAGSVKEVKEVESLMNAPVLRFPCTPSELLDFVGHPDTIPGHFTLPSAFLKRINAESNRERQRDGGAIQDDINQARKIAQNPDDHREVFRLLAAHAGKGGVIIEATADLILWRNANGGIEKMTRDTLRARFYRDRVRRSGNTKS